VREDVHRVLGAPSNGWFSFCHVFSLPVEAAVAARIVVYGSPKYSPLHWSGQRIASVTIFAPTEVGQWPVRSAALHCNGSVCA
jgi:hypothetical protein